jgi:hypothetical protein
MKGRRRLALILACTVLPLGVASAAGIDNLVWHGSHTRAVIEKISDPLSILASRSPGSRRADALRQTKPGHTRLAALTPPPAVPGAPEERVLAALRERPPEPELMRGPGLLGPADLGGLDALPFVPNVGPSPLPTGFNHITPPGGLVLPPTSDSPPGGTPPVTGPPGGGGPVPEPAAWAMMIMSMFAVGGALRLRRRKLVHA